MRSLVCLSAGLIAASAFAGTDGSRDGMPPATLAQFKVTDAAPIVDFHSSTGGETECRAWWDNGDYDGVSGLNSQRLFDSEQNVIFEALVADDFFLKFGKCYWIETIEVCFAVFGTETPDVHLDIYDDCNGKPSVQAFGTYLPELVLNEGPLADWPGFTKYRFVYRTELFEYGYRRLWLIPVGQGKGLYYWLTSNSGVIQGVQGQYKSAAYGVPDWTDAGSAGDDCPECSIPCTDFNFKLCGKCCWLLKDNSEYDTTGLSSIAFANGIIFGSRSVDNFQVPPGKDIEVCRIEAWMATNCDVNRAFMEIYNNDCDMPTGSPITIQDLDVEQLFNGETPIVFDGIPVYRFSVTCPGIILAGGNNYWLSMAALGFGTPHERAIWLFKVKNGCHINITEGQYKNPFLAGFQDWTPVSHAGLAGEPRDFAFRLYAAEPLEDDAEDQNPSEPVGPAPGGSKDPVLDNARSVRGIGIE